jgi:outer membrane protein assembly factor BamB
VIADGCVYVYAHTREKNPDVELGEEKYPWLPEDKRTGMTAEEYQEYEVKRRDENERHAKAFVFEERLVCLDLNSGEIKWEHHQESLYTRFTQSSTPAVVDGRVFVLSPERTASCFDAATGEVVWKRRLPGDFRDEFYSSSFVVTGDVAVVACGPLYALNVSDGAILWQSDAATDYPSHSSPVIWQSKTGPIVIANTQGGQTEAWSLRDGKRLWMLESGASQSTPIVTGDLLLTYGGSRKSGLRAFSMDAANPDKTPEEKWSFQGAADQGSTPAVFGQHVFVQGEKRLAKVDLETGRAVWQETLKVSNPRYTSLVVCGNQVFYGWEGLLAVDAQSDDYKVHYDAEITRDGRLIAGDDLRRELGLAGKEAEAKGLEAVEKSWQENAIKSGPLNCASPAVSDGKIVIRLRESIVCYELTDK